MKSDWPLTGFGVPMMATAPSSLTHRRASSIAAGMLCIATWAANFSRFGCLWQYSCAPFVVGMRQRRRVVRREVVVHQDLPPARAGDDSDVDAFDIHGGQGRLRVEPRPRATWKCGGRARLRRRSSRLDAVAAVALPCAGIARPCTSIPMMVSA